MSTCTFLLAPESDPACVESIPGDGEADSDLVLPVAPGRPVELDGLQVDQLLLEAFVRARRRLRGAVVAISDRTMITNACASELVHPGDRRRLWSQAKSDNRHAAERDARFVLANGMIVRKSSYPVALDGCLVGVVVHLVQLPRVRVSLVRSPVAGSAKESGIPPASRATADATLLTGWSDLTDSERTVAELVGQGLSNKQTGRRLFISCHTVDYHLRRIFRKLGITSRVELARLLGEHYELLAETIQEDRIA